MNARLKNALSDIPKDMDNILFAIKHCLNISKVYYPVLVLVKIINITKGYIILYISKNVMNIITAIIIQKEPKMDDLYKWLLLLFAISVLTTFMDAAFSFYSKSISFKIARINTQKLCNKINELDVDFYDDPESLDKMKQVSQDSGSLDSTFGNLLDIFCAIVSLAISLYISIALSPLLAVLSVLFVIPTFINQRKMKKDEYELEKSINLLERKTGYLSSILMAPHYAKEVRLTLPTAKAGGFLLHRPPLANPALHGLIQAFIPVCPTVSVLWRAFAVIPIHSALTRCSVFANPL